MNDELYAVMALSLIIITVLLTLICLMRSEHERVLTLVISKAAEKEISWVGERQQLLDRIQAGSFAELKTQEIRIIKAQNGEKEPPKLEQL